MVVDYIYKCDGRQPGGWLTVSDNWNADGIDGNPAAAGCPETGTLGRLHPETSGGDRKTNGTGDR